MSIYRRFEPFYHKGKFPDRGPISLIHTHAPGDTLVLTGFLRDLARAYPNRFQVDALVNSSELLNNNPYATGMKADLPLRNPILYKMDYGAGIHEQKERTVHFLTYFHKHFERISGLPVPVTTPTPDLHFGLDENEPLVSGRYWVINAGGKADMTTKLWEVARYQQVVDLLLERGIRCVQIGSLTGGNPRHLHSPLKNVLNLLGRTTLRELMQVVRDADGVICGVTMLMHMAAALDRPCVVVAGGREDWYWESYERRNKGLGPNHESLVMPHRFLHTIGLLDCCQAHGCWKSFVNDGAKHMPENVCGKQKLCGKQWLPLCMHLIQPKHVLDAVMSYYEDKSLPPITPLEDVPSLLVDLKTRGILPAERVSRKQVASGKQLVRQGERIEFVPQHLVAPPEVQEEKVPPEPADIWNNPILGGKATFCILLYGDFFPMHKRCLSAVLRTVPKERRILFVGSNELCSDSVKYVTQLVESGDIAVHFRHASNDRKYPVMREMFHHPQHRIETPYLIWLDDDTFVDKDRLWFSKLGECIVKNHPIGDRCFGPLYFWTLTPSQRQAMRRSRWFKGRAWSDRVGRESPNEVMVPFASGSFWAMHTDSMRAAGIPDERIGHNGGDYTIGAQLWQNRFGMRAFSSKKEIVQWSAEKRRGITEKHFGT